MRTILYLLCVFVLVGCQPQPTVVEYIPADCERSPEAWMAGLDAPQHEQATEDSSRPAKPPKPPKAQEDPQPKPQPEPTTTALKPKALTDTAEAAPSAVAPTPAPALLDLNQASAAQLEELPGIGPALAGRIVEYRQRRPFRSVSQLRYVKGIGPSKYSALHKLVTTQSASPESGAR